MTGELPRAMGRLLTVAPASVLFALVWLLTTDRERAPALPPHPGRRGGTPTG
ncbi:hypothetical protein [Azospirillum sp. ST 5-10]|uniref:hypothetical protein n=1 Tax=unclassified Azospirillum TaxID=2630922 RepID=UPI003F49D58C